MKFTVELGFIENLREKVRVPFWFSGDCSIHLSLSDPKKALDTEDYSTEVLEQVLSSIKNREIISAQEDKIRAEVNKRTGRDIAPVVTGKEQKTAATQIEQQELKLKQLQQEAQNILQLSIPKIHQEVGEDTVTDGIISKGINDLELLEVLHKIESAKLEKARKKVLTIIEQRIKVVKENSMTIEGELEFEVEESDYAQIELDGDRGTIETIEIIEKEPEEN